jgi:DNA-binding beta-propeller fold protein YncE
MEYSIVRLGVGLLVFSLAFGGLAGKVAAQAGGMVYWTDYGTHRIQRAELDGSSVQDLVTTGVVTPEGIALDVVRSKMYWTDLGTGKIQRANLDGSSIQDLVTTGLFGIVGIALDIAAGKMYWTDYGTSKIQRANLDGSEVQDLVTTGVVNPIGVALDVVGGKMYWTDDATCKIQRANLDGSGVQDLVTTGLATPLGIALDLAGGKMYWADQDTHKIQRANLDGSGLEDLVTGQDTPFGIALDVAGGRMYWTDGNNAKIQRANLDGSDLQIIVNTGLISPVGISVDMAFLSFPLLNKTASDAVFNTVFDHSMGKPYCPGARVTAYTGETGRSNFGTSAFSVNFDCNKDGIHDPSEDLHGFEQKKGRAFSVRSQYVGNVDSNLDCCFLFYAGHPGYDYRTTDQFFDGTLCPNRQPCSDGKTQVLAAAAGIITCVKAEKKCTEGRGMNEIKIDHENGYFTIYLHLSDVQVAAGQRVARGQVIGVSGDTGVPGAPHLHFEVRQDVVGKPAVPVDPYGWQGAGTDPYRNRATNRNLWK